MDTTTSLPPGPRPTALESKQDPNEKSTAPVPAIKPNENNPKPVTKKGAKPNLPSSAAPGKADNPSGNPTGYIGRKDIILQKEPSPNAQKIGSFKIYEAVIILETKMTDEAGKVYDFPQWYKVQSVDKKVGWVVGHSVVIN